MFTGFNDLGMNDLSFLHHQLQVNSLEELFRQPLPPAYGDSFDHATGSNQAYCSKRSAQTDLHNTLMVEKPSKQLKNNDWSSYDQIKHVLNSQDHDVSSTMLSFSNSSSCSNHTSGPKEEAVVSNVTIPSRERAVPQASLEKRSSRSSSQVAKKGSNLASMPQQSMDHILAERRRREKLSQRFIALSAIIPGLKKMDKASVLGDAIKYVKQMQERVKTLEENAKKKTVESAIFVKRSYVSAQDDHFSGETTFTGGSCQGSFPEIEVRFSDKDVLIRIHCEKKKGVIEKLISQIEELHLVIINSSSLAFGGSTLAVTIIAQVITRR